MADKTINTKVRLRYDSEANWKSKDPVLLSGEMAISSDKNGMHKVGNGTSKWSALSYVKANLNKDDVVGALGYTPPTSNTWRGIQNNLTSDATDQSLAAAQGKILKGLIDDKAAANHKQAYTSSECTAYTADDNTLGVTPAAVKKAIGLFDPKPHTHSYAGSSSSGGSANSAEKLTSSAGSTTRPIYFSDGKPAATAFILGANIDYTTASITTTDGWKTLGGRSSWYGIKAGYSGNSTNAPWTCGAYSDSIVFGANDTKGMLNIGYTTPSISFAGGSVNGSTDAAPAWYFKLNATSGQTYTMPSSSKVLCANDGSNASGTWGINISGNASTSSSAVKLDSSAGSSTQPVYFSGGKPVAIGYTIAKSVPSNAVFTDTNTWRPLGTTADTACAGNDSRLSNARPASDVYSWAKASSKPSYSWSEITGKPSTFSPSSHNHSSLTTIGDARGTTTTPNTYSNALIFQGLKNNSTIGISNAGTYSYVLGLRGWSDSSGGNSHELAFNDTGIYTRKGATTSWESWRTLLDSSNYKTYCTPENIGAAASSHTHNYAGSSSAGGAATSANKLNTNAGSSTQPVYFSNGVPVACSYTLGKSVPSNAVFTDTNTWRGVQNNLTSDSTSDSLSAAQGKVLKGLVDGKAASSHTHAYLPLSGGTVTGITTFNTQVNIGTATTSSNARLEMYGNTPYIDFHSSGTSTDFTSRIIAYSNRIEFVFA